MTSPENPQWAFQIASALLNRPALLQRPLRRYPKTAPRWKSSPHPALSWLAGSLLLLVQEGGQPGPGNCPVPVRPFQKPACLVRSEEHTSELQSLMRISYAVFCLKKQKIKTISVIN